MENKAFKKILSLYTSLMELHEENPFKIRNLSGKIFNLDRLGITLNDQTLEELENHPGIGNKLASAIVSIRETGSFEDLDNYLKETPEGVVEMLGIKGIGAKKVRTIWKDLGVDTIEDLVKAGQDGQIATLPGFGEKTQTTILEGLEYKKKQEGKGLYAEWEPIAEELERILSEEAKMVRKIGGLALGDDILESLDWLIDLDSFKQMPSSLSKNSQLKIDPKISGPFVIRGKVLEKIPFSIRTERPEEMGNAEIYFSSPPAFLKSQTKANGTVASLLKENSFKNEDEFFNASGFPNIEPELRAIPNISEEPTKLKGLLQPSDIKGVLHAHSTYSDGQNSIEEMVQASIEKGYSYFGLTDHSKSAFYANGLDEDRIVMQHEEVDELNKKYSSFKIFKGIESDILNDGSLDYDNDVLKSFDFIIASVHSNLKMDVRKATARIINAIENPYTTMLGHPTGRLLLRREGYPINHKMIIEACAKNNVIIEINANPWRLDIDWTWIPYAQDQGVKISINPDAHEIKGIDDIRFGVLCGRKGGLLKENTFNTMEASDVEAFFEKRKP